MNINPTDKDRNQPLQAATRRKNADICQLLVDHHADVTSVNNDGDTSLLIAASCSDDSIPLCCPLITKESLNLVHRHGNCAFYIAVRRGYSQVVKMLLDWGADTNSENDNGQTPLHAAGGAEKDYPELRSFLLKHKAKIDAVDKDGNHPLHLPCKRGHTRTSHLLVSNRADVNAVNVTGQTPLQTAAGGEKDSPELCSSLLEHKAMIDAVDKDGNQPLHLACKQRHFATANLFLSYGADVTALNKQKEGLYIWQVIPY